MIHSPLDPTLPRDERSPPTPAEGQLAIGARIGRFIVLHVIGQGGMGVVYAAYDPDLQRNIAVKLVRVGATGTEGSLAARTRLVREAQALARLRHPHVVTVHDVGTVGHQVFIAMELVPGVTVAHWLKERRRSWREILAVFIRAGRGLAAAHAAGLVHRDFKPDNVLVAEDGEIRVVDFGLARLDRAVSEERPPSSDSGPIAVTAQGALLGTPAYMAPEQLHREPADARSDQFSFCVALHEALRGQRPFLGKNAAEILASMSTTPPPVPGVPGRARRALARGLRVAPGERHPSMAALVAELEHAAAAPRRALTIAIGSAAAAGAIAATLAVVSRPRVCAGAEANLAGVWDATGRERAHAALRAAGLPEPAWSTLAGAVDPWARSWVAMHTEACEATRLREEQSVELLDLRMACLHHRLHELRALVGNLVAPDRHVTETAVNAAQALTPVEGCANREALLRGRPPPPGARPAVDALNQRLAEVKELQVTGRARLASEKAVAVVAEARATGYRPLIAEALLRLGHAQRAYGAYTEAEASLDEAVWLGMASRQDELAAEGLIALTQVVGQSLARYADGRQLGRRAEAALERIEAPPADRAELTLALASILLSEGRYVDAEALYRQALETLVRVHGDEHLSVARALNNLGSVLKRRGRIDEAIAAYGRALALQERSLGAEHPAVAATLNNLGSAQKMAGRYEDALALQLRAARIQERSLGADSPEIGETLSNLGTTYGRLGRVAEAEAAHRRSLELRERGLGSGHPLVATSLNNLANVLVATGRLDEARALHERALAIRLANLGPDHDDVATSQTNLGDVALAQKRYAEAAERYRQATATFEKKLGPSDARLAYPLTGEGEALRRLGRLPDAMVLLERALTIRVADERDKELVAKTRFALAQAMWDARGDRGKARRLAEEARAEIAGNETRAGEQAEIEAWLRAHAGR